MDYENFYEKELRKIFGNDDVFSNTKYISGVCYGELDNDLKVKCQLETSYIAKERDLVEISIINRKEGVVDTHKINFLDVWGAFPVPDNPNFPDGIAPHIWTYDYKTEWYGIAPQKHHYEMLRETIKSYIDIFRDKSLEREQKPSIKKQLTGNKTKATSTPKNPKRTEECL